MLTQGTSAASLLSSGTRHGSSRGPTTACTACGPSKWNASAASSPATPRVWVHCLRHGREGPRVLDQGARDPGHALAVSTAPACTGGDSASGPPSPRRLVGRRSGACATLLRGEPGLLERCFASPPTTTAELVTDASPWGVGGLLIGDVARAFAPGSRRQV